MSVRSSATRRHLPIPVVVALLGGVVAILMSGWSVQDALREQTSASEKVAQAIDVTRRVQAHLLLLVEVETSQRGYLFTGIEAWLGPFETGVERVEADLAMISPEQLPSAAQRERWSELRRLTSEKLVELTSDVNLKRSGEADAVRAIALVDQSRLKLDQIRVLVGAFLAEQEEFIRQQTAVAEQRREQTRSTLLFGSSCLLALLLAAGVFVVRDTLRRNDELWLREGEGGVAAAMLGDQRIESFAASVLDFLTGYLGATVGTFFSGSVASGFTLQATHALSSSKQQHTLAAGDGFTGQAVISGTPQLVSGVNSNHLSLDSTTGASAMTSLLVLPTMTSSVVNGVIELAFVGAVDGHELALLQRLGPSIGIGLRMAEYRQRLERQLEQTQQLAEQLQAQQEELRVNNEELEEQSNILRDAQARLEEQQNGLEEANERLQAQTMTLAQQQHDLEVAADELVAKNGELERSSQYKSNFLANMSHELRTPLNSSLLLARLLIENKDGNLTSEQITFAQTIHDAGHDLLELINDVLDISKIEAGRIETRPQTVSIAALTASMSRLFDPVSEDTRLPFHVEVAGDVPECIESDPQRIEQILKNLLSNAFKFTDSGAVSLTIACANNSSVTFAVSDTGVGIAADKHAFVFEAFRQLDDGTARKHGGTGLGLAISNELARLLGGDLTLTSAVGKGSTFTLTLPLRWSSAAPEPSLLALKSVPASSPPSSSSSPSSPSSSPSSLLASSLHRGAPACSDDGMPQEVPTNARTLVIVDDDAAFASVLTRVVRAAGHDAVVAETADAAVELIRHHMPCGVLLDIGLPDHSGLAVLDRLKRDPRTRHIPVHIVSGSDENVRTALAMGAVGFILKPVDIDEVRRTVERLVSRADARQKRVLVIERDVVQRESVRTLLSHDDVVVVTATTSEETWNLLREQSFDCIVMDLDFPDETAVAGSGELLLHRMAQIEGEVLPPVIVYAPDMLTAADEERLGRLSRSIIVKGARSPERLLDEVTLFLHQVESELPPDRQRMLRTSRDRDQVFEGRTLLIVEDDVRNIFALSRILEPRGARIAIARNGIEALKRLEAHDDIDLVLMDVMMPEMDGLEATRRIREQPKWAALPIIALTAKAMRDDQEKCLAAGANDYVAKPIDVDKLVSLIRVWMPRARRRAS